MITTKLDINSAVKWLLLGSWIVLFIGGLSHYTGSWLTYTVFSFVFLILLLSGFYRQISYGYLFLVLMLWLGFWFKLTVHTLIDFRFGEPVGLFDGSPSEWDEVLWISTIGGASVLLARFIYALTKQPSTMIVQKEAFTAPAWYAPVRWWIWSCVIFIILSIAFANLKFGIFQVGLVPRTTLVWPFYAVISWFLGYGFTLVIATMLWWDVIIGKKISVVVYFVLIEGFTSAVSMFSRGSYIFHIIPQFLALFKNRHQMNGWSKTNITAIGIAFVALLAISNPLVNSLREFFYSGDTSFWSFEATKPVELPRKPVISNTPEQKDEFELPEKPFPLNEPAPTFLQFAVDRWIGIEGVMAVSAYPKRSGDLFTRALTERAEIGKTSLYQKVCQSHYRHMDLNKFQFNSLPGAVGFFYFSGYLWVVAGGMVLLTLILLSSEWLVYKLTANPILIALWGGAVANSIVQFGSAPRSLLIYFLEMSCGIAAICLIQSRFFSKALQKVRILKSA